MAKTDARRWFLCITVLLLCVILCLCVDTQIFSADEWEGTSIQNVYLSANAINTQDRV